MDSEVNQLVYIFNNDKWSLIELFIDAMWCSINLPTQFLIAFDKGYIWITHTVESGSLCKDEKDIDLLY